MDNTFLFVLGSNWRLSISELDHFLKHSPLKGKIKDYSANIAIVEFTALEEKEHFVNSIEEIQYILGGCQKIANVYDFIDIGTIKEAFPVNINNFRDVERKREKISKILEKILVGKNSIFPRTLESMFFINSIYPVMFDDKYYPILVQHFLPFLNKTITNLLYDEGAKKVSFFRYPKESIEDGSLNPIFPHHVIKYELLKENRAEIIFGFTEEGVYIGRTYTTDDPNFKQKIDEERPFVDFKSSIPPKLAQIMLNYLNLFENRHKKRILDPFVGNGTIAMFACLQDFQIYGSDKDGHKVKNTIRNMYWLHEQLEIPLPPGLSENFKKLEISELPKEYEPEFFDGICTEPYLGPFYKDTPYYNEAVELIQTDLEPLMEETMRAANELLKSKKRICIISPIISTIDGGEVQIDLEKIAKNNDFRLIPLIDSKRIVNKSNIRLQFRKKHFKTMIDAKANQIINRKIFVFEKNVI